MTNSEIALKSSIFLLEGRLVKLIVVHCCGGAYYNFLGSICEILKMVCYNSIYVRRLIPIPREQSRSDPKVPIGN